MTPMDLCHVVSLWFVAKRWHQDHGAKQDCKSNANDSRSGMPQLKSSVISNEHKLISSRGHEWTTPDVLFVKVKGTQAECDMILLPGGQLDIVLHRSPRLYQRGYDWEKRWKLRYRWLFWTYYSVCQPQQKGERITQVPAKKWKTETQKRMSVHM